jgi:hypothetical protein
MDILDPNIVNDSSLIYIVTYNNNLFRITPHLHNAQINKICMYHQNYYLIFRRFAYENPPCVIVKLNTNKYIINANILISSHNQHHDTTIYFDTFKVNCYPGSKLWKKCKLAIQHNFMVITRIHNFLVIP